MSNKTTQHTPGPVDNCTYRLAMEIFGQNSIQAKEALKELKMECKYTPGPWAVKFPSGNRPRIYAVNDKETTICDIPYWHRDFTEELNANARLIAAAPELLEALHATMFFVPIGTLARERADAAIAKAEGK